MKIVAIIFIFLAYSVTKALILNAGVAEPVITFPTFEPPDITFVDLSAGCGGFTDCIEFFANVVRNIGAGIIFIALLIVELVTYIFALFAVLTAVTFSGVDGAPWYVNTLLVTPFVAAIAFIIYRLIRSGDSSA